MRVVLTGATGMLGGGVLSKCLEDQGVETVLSLGRRRLDFEHPKLTELVIPNLFDLVAHGDALSGFHACFYCLGVSSVGMSEADYRRVTHDLTLAITDALSRHNANLVMCYVSGQGTDSTGAGRLMWARVKGEVENELFARNFPAYAFRPGLIQPLPGRRPRRLSQRVVLGAMKPVFPLVRAVSPGAVTSAAAIGQAMIRVARDGSPNRILGPREINAFAGIE